jgi:GDP-L-fucose synthase
MSGRQTRDESEVVGRQLLERPSIDVYGDGFVSIRGLIQRGPGRKVRIGVAEDYRASQVFEPRNRFGRLGAELGDVAEANQDVEALTFKGIEHGLERYEVAVDICNQDSLHTSTSNMVGVSDFFARRRVLVTGGAGFLGKVVCRKLAERGAGDIVVPRSADFELTRSEDVEKLFADSTPDLVIHLAARVGGIGANRERPADIYVSNLLMGTHVIEEARKRDVGKTVIIGTICAYPKFTPVPFKESALWDGYPEETNAPYGIAKKALLVHGQANRAQYGQNVIYLLPTNLYGPGDKFNPGVSHVIPALIKKCVDAIDDGSDHIEVWGTGSATREFLYVEDCAEGILQATEHYDEPEPLNLGAGREVAIRDLVELIAELTGFDGELRWDASKPDGQPRRAVDASRARAAFGFSADTELRDGLRQTIDWYRANREDAEKATL